MLKLLPAALAATLTATAALAQVQDSDPKLPPPSEQVPEKVRPQSDGGGATLSEKLEKSDGVIKPPGGVDPEIKTIPPDNSGSSMPIIKPQGDAR